MKNIEKRTELLKVKADKQVILGVVYAPNDKDTDGNYMTAPKRLKRWRDQVSREKCATLKSL